MDMKVKEDQIRELELKVQVWGAQKTFSCLASSSVLAVCSALQSGDGAFLFFEDFILFMREREREPECTEGGGEADPP